MSTHAAIIAKIEGTWKGIYVHHDGYLSGVGRMLYEHYFTAEKVAALIARGDMSSVNDSPEGCSAYVDCGEDLHIAEGPDAKSVAGKIDHNHNIYIWDNGWTVGLNGRPLSRGFRLNDLAKRAAEQKDGEFLESVLKMEDELRTLREALAHIRTITKDAVNGLNAVIEGVEDVVKVKAN